MAQRYEDIFRLMQDTAAGVVSAADTWKGFLGTAAMNYKRPFYNQLLIYAQRPEATACATFDYWNKKMGRFVKKGSKGIATLNMVGQQKEILFDISDTKSNSGMPVHLWAVTEEMYVPLGMALQEHLDLAVTSGDLAAVLFDAGETRSQAVLQQAVEVVRGKAAGSRLAELGEDVLRGVVKETLSESVSYMLLKRCNVDVADYSEAFKFSRIQYFNTPDSLAVFGEVLNSVTKELFRDISLAVRSIEKTLALRDNTNKEVSENGIDIPTRGGLSDSQRVPSEAAAGPWEVRSDETDLSDQREALGAQRDGDERDAESAPGGDRRESDGSGDRTGGTDGIERGRDGEPEGDRQPALGGSDEQLPAFGGRDYLRGDDSRLTAGEGVVGEPSDSDENTAGENAERLTDSGKDRLTEKHPALSLEYVLTSVLQHHKYLRVAGPEIQNYFLENEGLDDRREYLRNAYNNEYTELITPEDEYRVGYHAGEEGLEVWIGAYLGSDSRVVVPWDVVVQAVDVLIKNDQFLSLSEKADIPTEEQQEVLVLEALEEPGIDEFFALPQQVIDEIICSGSNTAGSNIAICGYYKRGHTPAENVQFLEEHYGTGTGKGFVIDGEYYSAVFEEEGIRVASGRGVHAADESVLLPWRTVDKRIKELLTLGRYMSAADYEQVENALLAKTAEDLWYVHREILTKDLVDQLSLDAYGSLPLDFNRHNFTSDTEALAETLKEPETVKALADETRILIDACVGKATLRVNEPPLRVSGYNFIRLRRVCGYLDDLARDVVEFSPERAFEPSYKVFITEDEVDFDLMGGSHMEDGKYRIYLYFNEPHTAAEKAEFLKNEYGTGGGNSALGGVFYAHNDHDSKGLTLSKGSPAKPYDSVSLSWSAVAKRVENLIAQGRYLSEKEIADIPRFEKELIATEIFNFFSNLPLEYERPYSYGLDFYSGIEEVAKRLDDPAFVEKALASMQAYMRDAPEEDSGYSYKVTCLKDMERFASGVSLFDFEARKAEWEKEAPAVEVAEKAEKGVSTDKEEVLASGASADVAPVKGSTEATIEEGYTYVPSVDDRVTIGTSVFEVAAIEAGQVVVTDIDFPLLTETYSTEEFVQKVLENPGNAHLRVPLEAIGAPEAAEPEVDPEKLRLAAEALAEVEKRYVPPKDGPNRRTTVCKNYNALKSFAGDVLTGKYQYMRFESEAFEPLSVELIDKNTIAMSHTYIQNGDLMYDPEMVFTFDNEKQELQAVSYEMSGMVYQRVYGENGAVNLGLQRELNSFLNYWLKNIVAQKQPLVRAIDQEGNEIAFGPGGEEVAKEAEPAVEPEAPEQGAIVAPVEQAVARSNRGFDFDEYLAVKELYPDDLVAYRLGDFYEFLGEDAEVVAKELGLVLTSRDVGLSERLDLCGVPMHAFQGYCEHLIQNGYNVAVHGFNEKAGKVITVDFETTYSARRLGSEDAAGEPVAENEKLVFEPDEQPERVPEQLRSRVNRGELLDHRIVQLAHSAKFTKERFRDNVAAISLLKQIEADGRLATAEEQKVLAAYVGWGGLSDAFDESKTAWASEYAELKALLTPEEYASARASTLSAFYTSPEIIEFMYATLEKMGFKKGNILEPSCGVGNFIGMLPDSMEGSKVYGVELDSISGRIAQQLYQKQDIRIQGFEKTDFPDSFFDVAIGNVPFGQFKVSDKRYDKNNFLIHDYFFAKALDKVRPGGIVAFITSKGTLDKENSAVRKYLAEQAELLGAVRLPDNAFKANAGTEVTSDILFLKKRPRAIEIDAAQEDWIDLEYLPDRETGAILEDPNGEFMTINSYFYRHPDNILGEMKVESTQYGYDTACKAMEGKSLREQLAGVSISGHMEEDVPSVEDPGDAIESLPADPDIRNFSYTVVDGLVYFRENSRMYPQAFADGSTEARVKGLVQLRDCVRRLIDMQLEDYSEPAIIKQREVLNAAYDVFQKKYGLINSKNNKKAFVNDSSYYLLAALEELDDEGNFKQKADIFRKRTIKPHVEITHVNTSAEALEVSISERARVDIPFMMALSGKTADELEKDLTGVIFRVPNKLAKGGVPVFVPADEYLSGNVREKLKVAREFAEKDESLAVNVSALEMVQPKDLDASEISIRLGTTWIPTEYINQFIYELLDTPNWCRRKSVLNNWDIDVKYSDATGEWFIENKNQDKHNIKASTTYGTGRVTAYKIIEDTLNLRDTRVYDYVEDADGRKKAVLNREETSIAQQKQELIKEAFGEWIWKDARRREYLTSYYNEHFNCIRPREYDGSHLTFDGINPEIVLQKHQLNAIARILYGGNTLLAHAVGAGKTFEMVAAAQESKRLGLCHKSMFVVPNHLIEQFAADYMRLYPGANILCSTKKDFEPGNRKRFCSRIATGDYDAVIIGHSQFERIPMSEEGQRRALQEQLDDVVAGIIALQEERGSRFSIKQLEKTKKNIEAKLERLNDESRKDDVVTFEELGVDRLFVDEAHYYKNLFLYTKMRNVAGLGSPDAKKTTDLFMKCRYLDKITGGRGVIFATGTPISNSMSEMYSMQRYLQYDLLSSTGMQHFDAWAAQYGETVTAIELAPEGTGYRAKTRFARFNNIPELMATFKEMADVQTADMLHLPVPKANFHTVALQPSEAQKEVVQGLAERARRIHEREVHQTEDNMLLVTNDGRKLALDQRLIDPLLGDYEDSKVQICAENVYQIWQDTAAEQSTQLVFCDLSTPKSGDTFDVYNAMRDLLVEKGIPKKEIAFVHSADTETKKKALFENVRKGKVRVLLGSTQKLGVGSNVQDKLIALHDLDCPWRPADLEQRLGRIVRQGNGNDEVEVYRYVTKDTFDAYSWQLIENKQNFISQILTSKSLARSAEDIDESVLSYAEIKSLATGDLRIKEKMDLDVSVKRLKLLKQSYLRERYSLEDMLLKTFPKDIAYYNDAIASCRKDIALVAQHSSTDKDYFSPMTVGERVYAEKGEAGEAIIAFCKALKGSTRETVLGQYKGFKMTVAYAPLEQTYRLVLENGLRYPVSLGADKFGNITRINNVLDSLPQRLEAFENKLANTHLQVENAKAQLEKPFKHEQELKEKSARLDRLNIELSLDKDNAIDIAASLEGTEPAPSRSGRSRGEER